MKPRIRPAGFALATGLTLVMGAHQGRSQDPKPVSTSPPVNSSTVSPLTGRLIEAQRKGEVLTFPEPTVDGKPFVYPPPRLEQARDDRRVDPDVTVSVVIDKTEFQVMEPIPIKVEILNTTDEWKFTTSSENIYRVVHVNGYECSPYLGGVVPKTLYEKRSRDISGKVGSSIAPREVLRFDLFVNLPNDMTWPGQYSCFVEMNTGGLVEIDGKMMPRVARSKEFKVKIIDLPRKIGP